MKPEKMRIENLDAEEKSFLCSMLNFANIAGPYADENSLQYFYRGAGIAAINSSMDHLTDQGRAMAAEIFAKI